jgi:two-component system, OmpR family, sensor histidine kinase CreC
VVRIRIRLFLAFLLVVGLGFYGLIDWILDDLRPRYLETMEESMVDTATLLASLAESQMQQGAVQTGDLRTAFEIAQRKKFSAKIYEMTKTHLSMRVYITDRNGIVVFDSDNGRDEGKDYSRWNDVARTLRGDYGARSTRSDPDDPTTSTLHVASPVRMDGDIVGVLTVCKPAGSVTLFLEAAKRNITTAGLTAAIAVIVLGMVVSWWITWPILKLTGYAKAIRDGRRITAPKLGGGEIGALGTAFEEMRSALEGKQYVENYVQALTHQMKSPLSAIRGAAELLEEDMPPEQRRQFLENLRSESGRIQDLVDRMLQLSALENRKELRDLENVDLTELVAEVVGSVGPALSSRQVEVAVDRAGPVVVRAERFLVRQAVSNLLQNAIDFSESGSAVSVSVAARGDQAEVIIADTGPGIPEYAKEKIFERFFSLPRPGTGRKSSGLGLAFVREVAVLHGGEARLENRSEGGARALLALPRGQQQ